MYIKLSEIFSHARTLIARGWTQHAHARDICLNDVDVFDPDACQFCIEGALINAAAALRLTGTEADKVVLDATLLFASTRRSKLSVMGWNDDHRRTKEEVLRAIDKTIVKAQRQETAAE